MSKCIHFSKYFEYYTLTECAGGSVLDTDAGKCNPCQQGEYKLNGACAPCPDSQVTYFKCSLKGEYKFNGACEPCPDSQVTYFKCSLKGEYKFNGACAPCPDSQVTYFKCSLKR